MNQYIKESVSRFLGWKLPADFAPDAGITFKSVYNKTSPVGPSTHEPIGTNLFHAGQAEAMLLHVAAPLIDHITELEAKLADAKQVANDSAIVADNAIAEALGAKKDAERYRWLCDSGYNYHGAMVGSGSMSLCRGPYILLEPPALNKFSNMVLGKPAADVIIDAAISERKA